MSPAQSQARTDRRAAISLTTYLTRLIWLCVLPLMLLAAWLAYASVRDQGILLDAQAMNLARNSATAIDYFIDARIRALNMLAASPLADDPARWPELYREAQGFHAGFGSHVIFADAGEPMRMLFNTRVAYGSELPPMPRPEGRAAAPAAAASGRPAVGDMFLGPIANEPLVAMAVPVLRQGRVVKLMLTVVETAALQHRLGRQALPEGWALSLLDGRAEVIARHAPAGFAAQGRLDAPGRYVVRSAASPWTVVVEIPGEVRRMAFTHAGAALGAGVLGATLFGVLGGTLAGRRLARAVAGIVGARQTSEPPAAIAEIVAARRWLDETSRQRAAAETQLRKLSRVIEQTASTVVITDAEGRIEYVNPRFTETSGHAAAEVIGRRPSLLKSGHTTAAEYARLWRAITAGEVWHGEFHNRRKDGTLYWESATLTPIRDVDGRITHFAGIKEEITERKQMEAALRERETQLRQLIDHAPAALAMFDRDMRYLAVSRRWLVDYGLGDADVLGRSHYEVFPEVPARWKAVHRRALAGETMRADEDRFERADGTVQWLHWVVQPWWTAAGTAGGIVIFSEDITARKQAEAALRAKDAELEQLMKRHVASQTAAAIAHELNQPLNAIASYAEAALRLLRAGNPQPDRLQRAIEGGTREAQRAGQVVRELLAFMKAGEVETEPVDLNDVIRTVLRRVEVNLSDGFLSRLDLAEGLPAVKANRLQVEKVLLNLVQNGIEAMREAGIDPHVISVTVRTSTDGGMAQVTVRDSGPGIDEQALHHIFDPFFTTKPRGTGMGLAISRAIIEAHGGQLWLEVGPGPGATFHFTLPFHA